MARPGAFEKQIPPSVVQDAIVQIMQGDLGRARNVDVTMARAVAGNITTSVQKMGFRGASSGMLSGNSAFHTLVSQHLGSPAAALYDPAFRQQLQQAIDKANLHGPDYLAGVRDGIRLGLHAARNDGRISDAAEADGRRAGSSARYVQGELPAAPVPGNSDIRGITAANYYTSPVTRALVGMGMNDNTFTHLRDQGFARTHIERAANDADALGFSVNDKRMVKNHAVIRQKGKDPNKTNRILQSFSKGLDGSQEFRDAALELKNAKTAEEKKAAEAKIKNISEGLAKKHGVTKDMADQRDEAVKKAIGEIKDKKVEDKVKEIHGAAPDQRTAAEREQAPTTGADADTLLKAAEAQLAAAKPEAPKTVPATAPAAKAKPVAPQSSPPAAVPARAAGPAPKQ